MAEVSPIFLAMSSNGPWHGAGFSWLQAIGGTVAVFALLMMTLRLLGRLQGSARGGDASLLNVIHLGPRREVQVLRLKDEVHYIYRSEGALLLLSKESHAAYLAANPVGPAHRARPWPELLTRWLSPLRPPRRKTSGDRIGTVAE